MMVNIKSYDILIILKQMDMKCNVETHLSIFFSSVNFSLENHLEIYRWEQINQFRPNKWVIVFSDKGVKIYRKLLINVK